MRISDWSSDVCSSDLIANIRRYRRTGCSHRFHQRNRELLTVRRQSKYIKKADKVPWFVHEARQTKVTETTRSRLRPDSAALRTIAHDHQLKFVVMGRDGANKTSKRSEERREGKECVRPFRSGGAPDH